MWYIWWGNVCFKVVLKLIEILFQPLAVHPFVLCHLEISGKRFDMIPHGIEVQVGNGEHQAHQRRENLRCWRKRNGKGYQDTTVLFFPNYLKDPKGWDGIFKGLSNKSPDNVFRSCGTFTWGVFKRNLKD